MQQSRTTFTKPITLGNDDHLIQRDGAWWVVYADGSLEPVEVESEDVEVGAFTFTGD